MKDESEGGAQWRCGEPGSPTYLQLGQLGGAADGRAGRDRHGLVVEGEDIEGRNDGGQEVDHEPGPQVVPHDLSVVLDPAGARAVRVGAGVDEKELHDEVDHEDGIHASVDDKEAGHVPVDICHLIWRRKCSEHERQRCRHVPVRQHCRGSGVQRSARIARWCCGPLACLATLVRRGEHSLCGLPGELPLLVTLMRHDLIHGLHHARKGGCRSRPQGRLTAGDL